jgi:hypothetical protein
MLVFGKKRMKGRLPQAFNAAREAEFDALQKELVSSPHTPKLWIYIQMEPA